MRDDGGREVEDAVESDTAAQADGNSGVGFWDETLLVGTGDDGGSESSEINRSETDEDEDGSPGNVAGELNPARTIEPERPSVENALFVVLGAYIAVVGLTRLFVDQAGFTMQSFLVLTGLMILVSIVFLGFYGLLTPDT